MQTSAKFIICHKYLKIHSPPTMSEKMIIFIYSVSFYLLTWDYVTKTNCGHSDETEVEGIEECEVLIDTDKVGTKAEEDN